MSNIYRINVKWACLNSLGIAGAPATLPTTTLQVAEITQNSMRLSWNPLQGATGYVLRWGEVSGDKCASIFYVYCNVFLFTFWYMRINNNSKHLNCLDLSDIGRDTSVTLPASSSSYLVTGLRLGRQYRFTVQPTFPSGLGSASSVNERTGKIQTCALSFVWGRNSLFEFFRRVISVLLNSLNIWNNRHFIDSLIWVTNDEACPSLLTSFPGIRLTHPLNLPYHFCLFSNVWKVQ